MSDTRINRTTGIVGTTPTEGQTVVADKAEQKAPGKIAEKPGVQISGGETDGTESAARAATELAGTKRASPTGSVLGQIAHRAGDAKQYLLVGINDDSHYLGGEKEDALKAITEANGVELLREGGAIFGTFRVIAVDPGNAQKIAKEVNAIDGLFAIRASKLFDAPAMTGRAPAVAGWAAKLTEGSLPERMSAARRLLADLRAGKVGKDKVARDAIGDAIRELLGPTVSLFNTVHDSKRQAITEELRAAIPEGDDNKVDWNQLHSQAGALLMDPANRTSFEPARALTMELLETLDRLETPRSQAFFMELFRHADYAGFEYMRDNPASAKKLVTRWLKEADGRLEGLKKYMTLSEAERRTDKWSSPNHSGGYENLPNLHRSATEASRWSPDFPVLDFPTDPGLLLDSPVADHVIRDIEKLVLKVDRELGNLTKTALEREIQKEYDGIVRMYEQAGREITPEIEAHIRQHANDQAKRDSIFSQVDGLESLDRIIGMIPYHARNSWNCPASQDAVMSKAIDLHTSLLGKIESEGMGRLVINGALALIGFAKHWGEDMKLSPETLAKLPALGQAVINFEHDPKAVFMAAYSMGKAKMPEALPLLKAGLKSDDPEVRKTSVESIREFGEGAVPAIALMPLLEDANSHWIQADAAFTLLVVAPEQAEAVNITLRSLLKQEGSHRYWVNDKQYSSARRDAQRTSVIENLGNLGDAALPAAPVLAELLDDASSDYVRMAASITLLRMGSHTEAALSTIEDLTSAGGTIKWMGDDPENRFSSNAVAGSKEKDTGFRTQVIQELNRSGAKGEAALPLLRTLADDGDEKVAKAAESAIVAIEKKLD